MPLLRNVMATPEKISTPCHCALLRKASRHVSQFYDSVVRPTGLKITQISLLRAVYFRPEQQLAMNELAEILVMDRSTLGHNLRPLERDGFVKLVESDQDRRARVVTLTAKGRAKCEAAAAKWNEAQARFESTYGKRNTEALRQILCAVATLEFSL